MMAKLSRQIEVCVKPEAYDLELGDMLLVKPLRRFLSIALRILNAHDFLRRLRALIARAH